MADVSAKDNSEDVFEGLYDGDHDPRPGWEFNRFQATALGGLSLSILLTIVSSERLNGWLACAAMLSVCLSLPALAVYVALWSNRILRPWPGFKILLSVGQLGSALGLVALVATYSWVAAILLAATAIFSLWMAFTRIRMQRTYPAPAFHRTKMDRLAWAIWATCTELGLKDGDALFDRPRPSDFDGTRLKNVTFSSGEIEAMFQATLVRKLREARRTPCGEAAG